MLEKISMALETFASIYEGATKVFDDAKKDLHENYKGNLFVDKMKEAKDLYEKTIDDSRSEQWNICVSILDQVRAKAKEVITKPIEGDFSATLDAVKAMKEPSRKELEALADRYKGNYFAYRAFVDALGDRLAGYYVITVDEVLEACDDLQMMLHRCFYDGEGVSHKTLSHHSPQCNRYFQTLYLSMSAPEYRRYFSDLKEPPSPHGSRQCRECRNNTGTNLPPQYTGTYQPLPPQTGGYCFLI